MGLEFSKGFPITVTLAHAAFGAALSWLTAVWLGYIDSPFFAALGGCFPKRAVSPKLAQ